MKLQERGNSARGVQCEGTAVMGTPVRALLSASQHCRHLKPAPEAPLILDLQPANCGEMPTA